MSDRPAGSPAPELVPRRWPLVVWGLIAGLVLGASIVGVAGLDLGANQGDVAVAGASVTREPDPEIVGRLTAATVMVRAGGCGRLVGTGVMLRSGVVLSARHVLDGGDFFTVITSEGVESDGGRAMWSVEEDVVTGAAPPEASEFGLELATSDPRVGDVVTVASHPGGGPLTVRTATITGAVAGARLDDPAVIHRLDIEVRPGESGSPVVDANGDVVGILYAADRTSHEGLVIPVSIVRDALDDLEIAQTLC